ncbi:MAG TPA: AarF/ABC1/UbiB kinase family protein [Candidatus Hydrogenedentes bacterium]|nr:AarF/ABC1/UbiB kinase family protein [Candidatus Hydrogenedentota bacterium]
MHYTRLGQRTVNAVRFAEVLQVLVRHGFADLLRRAGFHDSLPARMLRGLNLMEAPSGEPATFGERLRAALTELGPTFIKFGQVLSTRPDLVGPKIADDLRELQDQVDPLPFDAMSAAFVQELDRSPGELYAAFNTVPVASASLSQVYHATLASGEAVAVKVLRPGVEKTIESDISLMRDIAEWVAGHMEDVKWLDPVGIVDEFARSVRRELDFHIEARIIETFRKNFEDSENIFIPRVHRELSTQRVLTMDWVDGTRIDRIEEYPARNCDPHTIAVLGCETLCRMVFEHRMFHADPHPGNVFILRDNRIAFLDLGMAGYLERTDVTAIADLFLAIFHEDSEECVEAILNLSAEGGPDDRTALEHEIADFIAFEAHAIIGGGQVAKGIDRAIQILRKYNLELAPRFSLLLKALGTVETVGRNLDPQLDFVTIIQPYVENLVYARYQPQQVMRDLRHHANAYLKLSRQLPRDLAHLLHQLRRGRVKFQVHHEHLDNLAATIDRSSNRNALSMITAALIIGSSLLITTVSPLSRLGLAGFIFAGLLGAALIVSILWSRKY